MNTLSLNGVNKHYGAKHALIDFDYDFTDGVYGLLWPNGAGKSIMMNIITQNIPATPTARYFGTTRIYTSCRRNTAAK